MLNQFDNMSLRAEEASVGQKVVKWDIVWSNVIKFIVLHLMGLHALVLLPSVSPLTVAFSLFCSVIGKLVSIHIR